MKTRIKIIYAIILLGLLGIKAGWANDEYSKVISRDFDVNPDAQLIIDNRFGKVHCNNWDKNNISLEIKIIVEASDENAAKKLMDKVLIMISGSPSRVEARTTIEGNGFQGKSKVNIDYMINMPATVNLDLTNKFGDIFINELSGKGKVNLSYGSMEVNKFSNSDNLIDIKFSKAHVKSIKGAVLTLKYSDMEIEYAGSLRLDSKYSNLDAGQIIALNVNFEGGKLNMENSSAVDSKLKFSDLNITRIEKSLNLDIQYGNCDVEEMQLDFSNIMVVNKYGNVSIGIPADAKYSIDAELKFCDLDFPEEKASLNVKIITNTSKSYKGTIGKELNPLSKVSVRSEFGNVSLE